MVEKVIEDLKKSQKDVIKVGVERKHYEESTMVFKVSYWIEEAIRVLEELRELEIIRKEGIEDEEE